MRPTAATLILICSLIGCVSMTSLITCYECIGWYNGCGRSFKPDADMMKNCTNTSCYTFTFAYKGRVSRLRGCGSVAQPVLYKNETTHGVIVLDVTPIWMWVCYSQLCNSQNAAQRSPPGAKGRGAVNPVALLSVVAVVAPLLARRLR